MLALDIVSDVMCPWCYIGKRRLEEALPLVEGIDLDICWRPFQLDPTIPPEGRDRKAYLINKWGSLERAREIYARVEAAGADVGIDFRIDAITVSPNTLNAHRVIRWAREAGHQDAVVERLFVLYFREGANLCDPEILAGAAADAGMDGEDIAARLAGDDDSAIVRAEVDDNYRQGISGVPSFIVGRRYLVSGAQPAALIADVIQRAASEQDTHAAT